MKPLQEEHVLILGLGISGLSMARWCARCGALVRVADTRSTPPKLADLNAQVPEAEFIVGALDEALLNASENRPAITRVLCSPGLSPQETQLIVDAAQQKGLPIGGELGLFAEALLMVDQQKRQAEEALLNAALERRAKEQALQKVELPEEEIIEPEAQQPEDQAVSLASVDQGAEIVEGLPVFKLEEFELGFDPDTLFIDQDRSEPSDAEEALPVVQGYQPKVIGITGSNGKTTVTTLTTLLVEKSGKRAIAAGNIGKAMLDALIEAWDENRLPDVWVLELSSFQLYYAGSFNPTVGTILNVSQDHLDWHGSIEHYLAAKGHVFGASTARVLNRNDSAVMSYVLPKSEGAQAGVRVRNQQPLLKQLTFGIDAPSHDGDFGLVEERGVFWLVQAEKENETFSDGNEIRNKLLIPMEALKLRGRHNVSNALAALALASSVGCDLGRMLTVLTTYQGEAHRTASIGFVNGVEFIDDSKGTNVGATEAALAGFGPDHAIHLILGGQGKGQDFSPLLPLVKAYVKGIALIGEDAKKIGDVLAEAKVPMTYALTLPEAVKVLAAQAQAGDVVMLSPACASLDMFKDYAERAEVFAQTVAALGQENADLMKGGVV